MADPFNFNLSSFPPGANPYHEVQAELRASLYPPGTSGYHTHVNVLLGFLAYSMVISALYLFLTLRETEKGSIWWMRFVERPAGKYLALNQYLLYPAASILLSSLWIAYVVIVSRMLHNNDPPTSLFYWSGLVYIALYLQLWTTTFAILSGGNLSTPSPHALSPLAANSLYLILLPVVIFSLIGVGVVSGATWHAHIVRFQNLYSHLERAAPSWDGIFDPAILQEWRAFVTDQRTFIHVAEINQHRILIVTVLAASLLILINLAGGMKLLVTLRRMRAGPQASPHLELEKASFGITLFFVSVPVILLIWMVYSIWLGTRLHSIVQSSSQLHLALFGMIWVGTLFSVVTMSVLVLHDRIRSDASSGPRSSQQHIVNLPPSRSSSTQRSASDKLELDTMRESGIHVSVEVDVV